MFHLHLRIHEKPAREALRVRSEARVRVLSCHAVQGLIRIIRLKAKAYVLWLELDLTGFQQ